MVQVVKRRTPDIWIDKANRFVYVDILQQQGRYC